MKKLGKLTLNEMQGYAPIDAEEQMAMKGGTLPPSQWIPYIVAAWKMAKDIMEMVNGSGGSTSPSCPPGSTHIYESDSVKLGSGTVIYNPKLVCLPCQ
jgi:hypothetical protein